MVLVNVTSSPPGRTDLGRRFSAAGEGAQVVGDLAAHQDDLRITKLQWGAFHGTALDLHLRRLGIVQVVIVGIATSLGVESTARQAHERGYHVVLPLDAMTDVDAEAHRNSVERIFPRLAETTLTAAVLAHLHGRGTSKSPRQL